MDTIIEDESPRARLALLLQQFSELDDDREAWRIVYPIEEVLLLVTCATIASCDDFEDIVEWGEHHLDFLRQFSDFHHGSASATSATARHGRIDTRASDRFCDNSCGPSRRSERNAPAALRIFSHARKRTFSTQSATCGRSARLVLAKSGRQRTVLGLLDKEP
jgi:hypothetical protein